MLDYMWQFFSSLFLYKNLTPLGMLFGTFLGLLFGAIWLSAYWPWKLVWKQPLLWALLPASAFLTWIVITLVQIPFQYQFNSFFGPQSTVTSVLLLYIPLVIWSAIFQEASKLVPVWLWQRFKDKKITTKTGLLIGAISGAGFGLMEAVYYHNMALSLGVSWASIGTSVFAGISPFWERFFYVAFHISATSLAGYGLAKGKWLKYYLLVVLLHAVLGYSTAFAVVGYISLTVVEIIIAVIELCLAGFMLWLRWKKLQNEPETPPAQGTLQQQSAS
jgi:hypothetical protein